MEYRKKSDGTIVPTFNQLKALFPNTSFPVAPTSAEIEALGYDMVHEGNQPSVTIYQKVERDGVEQVSGKWQKKYKIGPTFTDTTETDKDGKTTSRTAAENEAAYKAGIDNNAAFVARSHRDDKLAETDWWACSDVTLTDARKDYRKALRDIPSASGWPHTHTWPTKPS